ncbi:MAG TPA: cation:proton antiporter [Kofleriaceae bacterium]
MSSSHTLVELVIVLGSAAVVTVLFQALKLPVVLGYVLAGLVIGPHIPVPLVADASMVHVLSELGVILLMFTIGLELPLRSIARVGLPAAVAAVFEVGLVVTVGTLVARLVGLDGTTAIFAGACLGISSTMLVAKAFDELGWKGGFTETVFAVLVFEDLIAIVLLAIVGAVASGHGLDPTAFAVMLAKLAGFLALILIGGLLVVPRVMKWVGAHTRRETLLASALLVCFGMAAIAETAGYSVALGAFVAGVLVAESGYGHEVTESVASFRDVFAMMFFISVGMSIEPALLWSEAPRIAVFSLVVIVLKPLGVATGVFLTGTGIVPAIRSGLSLAQIGEFSFVIAGVLGDPALLAIAVGVSCVTTLTSPVFIRRSEAIAVRIAHGMPGRLATFVSFYEAWLAKRSTNTRPYRRMIVVLAVDTFMITAIVIAAATVGQTLLVSFEKSVRLGISIAAVAIACAPFLYTLARTIGKLARALATEMIPIANELDAGRAARRALVLTLDLGFALGVAMPIVAMVQPFVPASFAAVLLLAVILVLVVRRSLADFEGHVRAGTELVVEMLAAGDTPAPDQLAQVATILPGFDGRSTALVGDKAAGRSLAQLDLRARTGATVLAIMRGGKGLPTPSPTEPLELGDILAVTGSADAIAAARAALG